MGMLPQENLGICGYRDAFWCNLMAKLYSAKINLNQRKISIKTRKIETVQIQPRFCLRTNVIINKPC